MKSTGKKGKEIWYIGKGIRKFIEGYKGSEGCLECGGRLGTDGKTGPGSKPEAERRSEELSVLKSAGARGNVKKTAAAGIAALMTLLLAFTPPFSVTAAAGVMPFWGVALASGVLQNESMGQGEESGQDGEAGQGGESGQGGEAGQGGESGQGGELSQGGESGQGEESGQSGDAGEPVQWPQGPSVVAESGIVMEVSTGTILYEKNIDDQHYPASITKIMTVLLAIENCQMDEMVTVPHEAVYMEDKGSHIALDEGEELTVEHCLYAIMLASANDAAYALAIHIGGTIENFADMMNARAAELGCRNTHFVNPNGLPNEEHVTTAYDMALITRQALSYDIFRTVSATTYYEIPPSEKQKDLIPMSNHHKMLCSGKYHYDGAFSGKVGYTVAAQNTLVTCASRDGMELICVTMKTQGKQVYVDTATLLDFGFENFKKLDIAENETGFSQVMLSAGTQPVKASPDGSGYVVIPAQASFGQLASSLSSENAGPDNPQAEVFYTCAGRPVGSQKLSLEIPPPIPEPAKEDQENTKGEAGRDGAGGWKASKVWIAAVCLLFGGGAAGFAYQYGRICRERRRRGICSGRRSGLDET